MQTRILRPFAFVLLFFASTMLTKAAPALNIDSLKNLLKQTNDIEERANLLNKLGHSFTRKNADSAEMYFKEGLELCRKHNLKKELANLIGRYGYLKRTTNHLDEAFKMYEECVSLALEIGDKDLAGYALYDMGNVYVRQQETEKAKKVLSQAIELYKEVDNPKELSKVYNCLGNAYGTENNIAKAIENYVIALKYIDEIDTLTEAILANKVAITNNLGYLNIMVNQLDLALKYYQESLAICKKVGLKREMGQAYVGHANVNWSRKSYDQSVYYFKKAIPFFDEVKDVYELCFLYSGLGNALNASKKFDEVLPVFTKGIEASKVVGAIDVEADIYKGIGNYYMAIPNPDLKQAEVYYAKSEKIAIEIGEKTIMMEVFQAKAQLYKKLKRFELAFNYQEQFLALHDSLTGVEKAETINNLKIKYDTEKKELQIANLLTENKLERTTRNASIGIGLVLIISIALGSLYFSNRKTLTIKQYYTHQLVLTQEKERQRIAKELHDSVGQNILFIRNQLVKVKNEDLLTAVDDTLEEVRSISKDLYPNQLEKYGLAAAVEALADKLRLSTGILMSSNLDELKADLSPEHSITLYRIIQECVNNTIKHANATALRVSAVIKDNMMEMIIQDNGVGFDKTILVDKAQRSFGILNLEERVKILKGKFSIDAEPNKGVRSVVVFPLLTLA